MTPDERDQKPPADGREERPPSVWKKEIPLRRSDDERGADGGPERQADREPVWKKEISLRRRPKERPAASAARRREAEEESVWKKEISLRRKPKVREAREEPAASGAGERNESLWKKEISLRRKPKEPAAAKEPPPVKPGGEQTPVWKKEISLRRKPKEPAAAKEPRPVKPGGEQTPVWKKEISLRRKPKDPSPAGAPLDGAVPVRPEAATESVPGEPASPGSPPAVPPPGVHPPVRAAELAEAEKPKSRNAPRPLLKRDLSLSFLRRSLDGLRERSKSPVRGERSQERVRKDSKRLVGVKVGASQLAAAYVANNGAPELMQLARQPLPPGIVVGGEVRDPEALAAELTEFFRRHKLPKRGVRLGVASNRVGVRTFELTGIDDPRQLENAIRFRAQEVLPIPIDEAALDYQVLAEGEDAQGQRARRILLVVAYRELITRYVDAFARAGVKLAGIDLEAFALLRALSTPGAAPAVDAQAAIVAVSVGHDRTTFAVSDGTVCEFTRVFEWGGATINTAIARAIDLTPAQAEPVKRALSLEGAQEVPEGLTEEQASKAYEAVAQQLQAFARELISSLQFYQNQPGSLPIGEILLTGGSAHLPGFAAELQRLTGVRVRVGDPLRRVKVSQRLKQPDQIGSLAIAIGLGIED